MEVIQDSGPVQEAVGRGAMADIHKSNGHQDPTDNEGVRRVLKGIARAHGRAAKQAKPFTV